MEKGPKSKNPSYCDRVLYLPAQDAIEVTNYTSFPACIVSDHKPVLACFQLQVRYTLDDVNEALVCDAIRFVHAVRVWL